MQLAGRKALLVGAATGIGRATALLCAQEGARIVVGDINAAGGEETCRLAKAAGGDAWFLRADVRDESSVKSLVERAQEVLGGLDLVVNTAGVLILGIIEDIPRADWDLTFDINIRGQFLVLKHAIPYLKQNGKASIINVSSAAGIKDGAGNVAYSASKGAVIAFSRTLSSELAPFGIRVNAVCPGFVDTPFNQPAYDFMGGMDEVNKFVAQSIPLKRMGRPEEIAHYIVFLASDQAAFITGQAVLIDGGMM